MVMANETMEKIIDNSGVSIISSVDDFGFPNTKAMLPPRKREGIRNFYFTTNTSSMRVKQYYKNPKACIYFLSGMAMPRVAGMVSIINAAVSSVICSVAASILPKGI